jgi:probable rRNA maturation factor
VKLTITSQTGKRYAPFVRKQLKRVIALPIAWASRPCLKSLSIVLTSDRAMKKLHHEFMNENTTTDVLTFPIDTTPAGDVLAGEIYVCVPEARRQAKVRGIDAQHEVLLYALHGMLHLLGYDDRTARDFHAMHAAEDEILTKLGLGPVFTPPSKQPAKRRAR